MDTPETRAAYVNAQAAAATIRALGMAASNQASVANGGHVIFIYEDFKSLLEEHGLHPNALLTTLNGH